MGRGISLQGARMGLVVGVLGGAMFLGALYLPRLGIPNLFFRYPQWAGGLNARDYVPMTIAGLFFSILLSTVIEAAIIGQTRIVSRWTAGLLSGGCYLLVLGVLGCLAWFGSPKVVGSPPNLFGLDMVSPLALLTWVLVAAGVHAARRPTQRG